MILPGKCKKKKEMKKIEFVPYPVKEYIPIPMKKHQHMEHMPMEMPMEMPPMEHMDMGGMDGMDGMDGYGLASKRHVTRAESKRRRSPIVETIRNKRVS